MEIQIRHAEPEDYNQPGIALYQKYGFEIEGRSKQLAFRDSQYIDVYLMGRIRHE